MARVMPPIGIESFRELREKNWYYIDKTRFIEELICDSFKVMLFTRPGRFGKTLTMSMLADFLDIRMDSRKLFEGLHILENRRICEQWMNQRPVLFVTLKNINGLDFASAYGAFQTMVSDLCVAHAYLADSRMADETDRAVFRRLKKREGTETETKEALYMFLRMMKMHYEKPAVLIMDEYDVPLANANEQGYYIQMLDLVRAFAGKALKTNEFLEFAVITGCLRIAKESIFTGTNNFISNSVSNTEYSRYFGFTEEEVWKLLQDAGLEEHAESVRSWYDGYRFGKSSLYCPWDVLNHIRALQMDPYAKPENYWRNTSHNGIIRSFIDRDDLAVHDKFECLLSGRCVQEQILEDMTYDTLHSSEANLWSILYLTGYLTQDGSENGDISLKIPNEEIKTIFADTIAEWFKDEVGRMDRRALFDAFWSGNEMEATNLVTDILFDTISYFEYREDFYHAFLAGLFAGAGYAVESNREYGSGRPDLVICDRKRRRVILIELKHSGSESQMVQDCETALQQIGDRQYVHRFLKEFQTIFCFGVAFYKKKCLVRKMDEVVP